MLKGKNKGKAIRKRGNNYEVEIVKEFKMLGFPNAMTTRAGDRSKDNSKIDILFVSPFSIQTKCTNSYSNPLSVLKEMPDDGMSYNVVINKIVSKGEFVTMSKADFYELVNMLRHNKII